METNKRSMVLGNVRRVVVQVSSALLTDPPVARIRSLAAEVAHLSGGGVDVVLVTSGAIQLGMSGLGLKRQPQHLPLQQAAAAVGQVAQIHAWDDALAAHRIHVAQVMMTPDDLQHRERFLRLRHTMMALLDYGVVPVVNVNKSITMDEVVTSGTDMLAARVPRLVGADLLVMLTAADGIYDAPPSRGGQVIPLVEDIEALQRQVRTEAPQTPLATKVQAARLAGDSGVPTVVASGARPGALANLLDDDAVGTLLLPSASQRSHRRWIAVALEPAGALRVTEDARQGMLERGRSLLCGGVLTVEGDFQPGEAVRVLDPTGAEFARGLCGYSSRELDLIKGLQPNEVASVLGLRRYDEAIHKYDLVIL